MIGFFFSPFILFCISLLGFFLVRRHVLLILIAIELMLLSINLNFFILSVFFDDFLGQFFVLLILTVAAAESAIGLSVFVIYYRLRGTIFVNFINLLKG